MSKGKERRARRENESPRSQRSLRFLLLAVGTIAVGSLVAMGLLRRGRGQAVLERIPNQNVLLITIDTLRADALHCYGGAAATPALDQLAAEGVRFDFAHAHAVVTLASHASILTGTYPYQHGIRDNSGYRLSAGAQTAATLLKKAGYATGAFVAAFPLHSRFGLNAGFDVYDDRFGETRAPTDFVMPERPATAVVALARDWLAKQHPAHPAPALSTQHPAPSTRGSSGSTCLIRTRHTSRRHHSTRSTRGRMTARLRPPMPPSRLCSAMYGPAERRRS